MNDYHLSKLFSKPAEAIRGSPCAFLIEVPGGWAGRRARSRRRWCRSSRAPKATIQENAVATVKREVLEAFAPEERPVVEVVIDRAAEAVRILITDGLASAMNRYNVRVPAGGALA